MAKMTYREFYTGIVEKLGADSSYGKFALEKIAAINEDLEKRKKVKSEAQEENEKLIEKVFATFEKGVVYTAAQVSSEFGLNSAKASYVLQQLAKEKKMTALDVRIKACKEKGIKGRNVKGYKLVEVETENSGETTEQ